MGRTRLCLAHDHSLGHSVICHLPMNPTSNQPSDILYLDDMRAGDHVVCLGPNSSMHTPHINLSLYQTGRVYPVVRDRNPEREGGFTSGCGLFNWRRALDHERPPAEGHNPHGLTVTQVGLGWRLMTPDEVRARDTYSKSHAMPAIYDMQMWNDTDEVWDTGSAVNGSNLKVTYRTKLSPTDLAALIAPRPKVKVPLTSDDLPSICWVRWTETPDTHCLVTAVTPRAIAIAPHHSNWLDWTYMMKAMEYSPDRRTWRAAYKEVNQS